jgi:hypothetical protein
VYLSQLGEFDAEPAAIAEVHQQNGMRQSEVTFHHLALQHIAKESSELWAIVGMNEQCTRGPRAVIALIWLVIGHPIPDTTDVTSISAVRARVETFSLSS